MRLRTPDLLPKENNRNDREDSLRKAGVRRAKGSRGRRLGGLGIISGSMGARSYIVRGLGNPNSCMSCSHGAGRSISRTDTRRRFTVADHEAATKGIQCRKDAEVIHRTPAACKPIDAVMAAQNDLIEVVHTLRQVARLLGLQMTPSTERGSRKTTRDGSWRPLNG